MQFSGSQVKRWKCRYRLPERISCSIYSEVARGRRTVDQRIIRRRTSFSITLIPEAELSELECSPLKAAASTSEFKTASDEELKRLVENNNNLNIKCTTSTWFRHYKKLVEYKGMQTDLADVPREELDRVLQQFYAELVKRARKEYKPESLKVTIAAIDRYVREKRGFSILKDKDFEVSRKVLNGKAIDLQRSGMGKRPRKSDPLTEEDHHLWKTVLGKENSISLNYTLFFLISQHFGTRGCQAYELLVSKRPAELRDHGPLYLSPLRKDRQWSKSPVWFSKASLGVHSTDNFVNRMAVAAGLDVTKKHYTNHSIRKTTVKKLKKAGVSATETMAITGHKNQQSLTDYNELNEDHFCLSKILSTEKAPASKQSVQRHLPDHTIQSFKHPTFNHLQSLNPLVSTPNYVMPPAPVFNIKNSTVIFGSSSSSNLSQQFQQNHHSHKACKRAYILDSDSDTD